MHRSARRWTAYLLGDDWIVRTEQRLASEEDEGRNLAFVELATSPSTLFARSGGPGVPQGDVRRSITVAATLLPAPLETPQESTLQATELAEMLDMAVTAGTVLPDGTSFSNPREIPLWDWTGVPVRGPGRGGPDAAVSYAEVQDHGARVIPDPQDDRLYSIVLTMRMTWWSGGRSGPGGPLAVGGVSPEEDFRGEYP